MANDLPLKFGMGFRFDEEQIVDGLLGDDRIVEAFIVRFYPDESTMEWCEDRIAYEINAFLRKEGMNKVHRLPFIMRDVWLGRVRYGLVYSGG